MIILLLPVSRLNYSALKCLVWDYLPLSRHCCCSASTCTIWSRQSSGLIWLNRAAVATIVPGGLLLLLRSDTAGVYVIALGTLLLFCSAGVNAGVLLIEVNR